NEEEDGEDIEVLDNDYFENASDSDDEVRAKSDVLLNNMCEVFNGKRVGRRDKPIIVTLEFSREYLMKRIVNVNKVIERCNGPLIPITTKILKENSDEAKKYSVDWGGDEFYQVSGPWGGQVVVNNMARTCTCKRRELTSIPCKHVVATNWNMSFTNQQAVILEEWVAIEYQPQVDRPKKERRKSKAEKDVLKIVKNGKLSREHKTVAWDKCKTKYHNSRSYTGPRVSNYKKRKTISKRVNLDTNAPTGSQSKN
nr:hypothetical protein [Tanacetum cinerariifolium]